LVADPFDHGGGVPDAQRGLAGDGDLFIRKAERIDVLRVLHQVNFAGRLADHAFGLRVAAPADVDDVVATLDQVFDEIVGDDDVQAASLPVVLAGEAIEA